MTQLPSDEVYLVMVLPAQYEADFGRDWLPLRAFVSKKDAEEFVAEEKVVLPDRRYWVQGIELEISSVGL